MSRNHRVTSSQLATSVMKQVKPSSAKRPAKAVVKQSSRPIMSAEHLADSLGGASAIAGTPGTSRDSAAQVSDQAQHDVDDLTHSDAKADANAEAHSTAHLHAHPDADADNADRKAVHVDADARTRNLKRLRRIEGQVRGLQKMVEDDRYCADIMTQIASVHEALRSVGRELMRNHLKHCATGAIQAGEPTASAMYDELVDMMYKHSR